MNSGLDGRSAVFIDKKILKVRHVFNFQDFSVIRVGAL
jgi:hypothetical protein